MDEECMVCHEPTGKAGRDEDSLYTPNGVGPFCEQCWDDAWPVVVPAAADPALLADARTRLSRLRALVSDDRNILTFQTLGQYRAALLKALGPVSESDEPATAPALMVLAKLGARLCSDQLSPMGGFCHARYEHLDRIGIEEGVLMPGPPDSTGPVPKHGIADAIAALLAPDVVAAPDGAGEVADA